MLRVFGGQKCEYLSTLIQNTNAWILSVVSDECLPQDFLFHIFKENIEAPLEIHILGDFIHTAEQFWSASLLLEELVSTRFSPTEQIDLIWYDGDSIDFKNEPLPIKRKRLINSGNFCEFSKKYNAKDSHANFFEIDYARNKDNQVISAKVAIQKPFTLCMLPSESMKNLHKSINRILSYSTLTELRIPFCGLPELTVPNQLEVLDVRGNEDIILKIDTKNSRLRHINIAACRFSQLPPFVSDLEHLTTLLAYKNQIARMNIERLSAIKRLSVYRNLISHFQLDYSKWPNLRELNIGANPLDTFTHKNVDMKHEDLLIKAYKTHIRENKYL